MTTSSTPHGEPLCALAARQRAARALLILVAMACLVTGIWGGLVRLYFTFVPLTSLNVNWVSFHGPLMICGFLGTLIGVERAAALARWWAYPGPVLTAAGGLLLIMGVLGKPAPVLFVFGSFCLTAVTIAVYLRHTSPHLLIMGCGAAAWMVGNLLWLQLWPVHRVVLWWIGFLLLTIVAERLELSRFLQPSRSQRAMILLATAAFIMGLMISPLRQADGQRMAGVGMTGLAFWLLRYDVARRTIRQPGQPRFTAACLLSGYVWLAVAGLSLLMHAPLPQYGGAYDATLHAFFFGFVMAMIFGHAPIIFPAVLGVSIPFRHSFYAHLLLLHVSLLPRVIGDIVSCPKSHGWGGIYNAATIALFLFSTMGSMLAGARQRRQ